MTIEIKVLTLGVASTNAYIVGDTDTQLAVVIDPVDNADLLLQTADEAGWQIKAIMATHGHYDHVLACGALKQQTGAPFAIHEATPQIAGTADDYIEQLFPPIPQPDQLLTDKSTTIEIGNIRLETLFTPGHAPDHVCFFMREQQILFGGDCLFQSSVGRSDLPFGDHETLMQSIFDVIMPLGDSVHVLPGHMQPTTIGRERTTNPFLLHHLRSR